ncbi:GIY-YIG nuclease family protein [Candidatus Poribacteria bacterium]|nr:GIY-YIG nuclease family protein [Candidatus Poribacteria bacterium]
MNDQYEYVGKTFTPKIAQELIQELFAGQTVQKQEMISAVDEAHMEQGGLPSRAQHQHPVTLALVKMKQAGLANNPSQGNWSIFSTPQYDENEDAEYDDLEPEKIIGSGKQSVYLYYYPAYRRLAESQNEEVWACKVGMARNDLTNRVLSQTRTALPEYPKVGLVIKTDASSLMEKTIQYILRIQGKQKDDAPGREWFITSPKEVEKIYECIFGNLQ